MKIGITGVPGSGKTILAETLKRAFEMKEEGTSVEVIDNYVQEIEAENDLALSFSATYIGNLCVALGRIAREHRSKAQTTITCGTLLDTATYSAMKGLLDIEQGIDDSEQDADLKRIEASMKMLSCLYVDTFNYDHVFYLPGIQVDEGDERYADLDRNLQVAFTAFELVKVTPLMDQADSALELTEKRCESALKAIFEAPVEA